MGWVGGRNFRIEYRWATNEADRARVAQEIVALRPELIVASPTPITRAVQKATGTLPILFVNVSDPVGEGFVTQLGRPNANLTGFINFEAEMGGKWVELLKELAPGLKRVALMYNPATAPGSDGEYFTPSFQAAARALGVEPMLAKVRSREEIEPSINLLSAQATPGS